jgi:hypothetical protein
VGVADVEEFSTTFSTCPAPVGPVENSESAGELFFVTGVENARARFRNVCYH